jgi:hypothetical protein
MQADDFAFDSPETVLNRQKRHRRDDHSLPVCR